MLLPSERLELTIYRRIKPLAQPSVSVNLGMLSAATNEDHRTIVERLEALEAEKRISLYKYLGADYGPVRQPYSDFVHDKTSFFYQGSFVIEVVPAARVYFEGLEQKAAEEERDPLVFISCGQYSTNEIDLGRKLSAMIDEKTRCKGYFAENQNTLESLSTHIFAALYRCAGFVAVMHHRGQVTTPTGTHIRASVWIEQELAIVAFLTSVRKQEIPVLLYIQKGIKREGVREQLRLDPIEFQSEADVLVDFATRLEREIFKPTVARMTA